MKIRIIFIFFFKLIKSHTHLSIHPSQTDDIEKSDSKNKMEYEDLSNIDDKENSNSSIRDFLVVLALTFHAVLEGVAIGLEAHVNDVWLIFAGI